ncbi:MAG: phosphohistidine phosphatase SixA [Kangiellaceae bacterium]|nr:phosphohistidine phosphatase SixA [Kangiellaceae bacterium]
MNIYIMRHGDAPFQTDQDGHGERRLSALGSSDVADMARLLKEHLSQSQQAIDAVMVSPLTRAQETADIVVRVLAEQFIGELSTDDCLLPEANPEFSALYIEALAHKNILLVTHMPFVANLFNYWVPEQRQYFATSSIAAISIEPQVTDKPLLKAFFQPK